jgi:hypothetical protein
MPKDALQIPMAEALQCRASPVALRYELGLI